MKEIFERRSVRRFTGRKLTEEQLMLLLKAAMCAPSAGDERPWEFVVLEEQRQMEAVLSFHPYATPMKTAACAIVVCGNRKLQKFPEEFWIQDCSAAAQNILLEAVALGLGAVWQAVYPVKERVDGMTELLNLPEDIIPLCIIAVGYPQRKPEPVETFMPERIHRKRW